MFSLSYPKESIFPGSVKNAAGDSLPIKPDFRNILKIIRLMGDADVRETDKTFIMLKLFYTDRQPENPNEAVLLLYQFINADAGGTGGVGARVSSEETFDFEFDAKQIYSSFLTDYGIDLHEIDFMHWYKFKVLLGNLSENSPLSRRIHLRFIDLKDYKGEQLSKLTQAKQAVQLPVKLTADEQAEYDEFMDKMGN